VNDQTIDLYENFCDHSSSVWFNALRRKTPGRHSGKPMIQRVYEGVCQSRLIDEVMVATDDERILEAVKNFGGKAMMTSRTT